MQKGDRVTLTRSLGAYDAGAEGVIVSIPERGILNVDIDKDHNGNAVVPVDPLPPSTSDYFAPIS